ncbi:MAG: ABC transporter ATP-binding protein [Aphanocapsa feldmannii 288cV]|nr:MAG: ABC transporter ATP-binding protein [Aphanocapsa feldmannii 288cV]
MFSPSQAGFRRLLPLLRPHLGTLLLGSLCTIVFVLSFPLLAWLVGQLIPAIGSGDVGVVLRSIALALGLFLLQKLAQFGQDSLLAEPALAITKQLRHDLFAHLQRMEFAALEKLSSGDLTYRLTEDADRVSEVIYKTIHDSTPSLLQLLAVLIFMATLDWRLSLATLFLAPFIALLVSWFGARVMRASERSQHKVSELAGLLSEAIAGVRQVRAFAAEPWLQRRFDSEIEAHYQASFRTLWLLALQHPIVGFIEAAGILGVLLLGALRIASGELDGAQFSSYLAALLMLIDPISHLTTNFNMFQQGQASLRRLRAIEAEPSEAPDPSHPLALDQVAGALRLVGVRFGYDPAQPVLRGVDLDISAGQVVALVGPSGAGKSTLFSLLLRFNRPQSGRLLLDGKPLDRLRAVDLRRHIALVPQDTHLFSGTVADAIDFGRGFSADAIRTAARLANADGFIKVMPGGYRARLEERGSNLSGGQRQRIAIARAVLGNPAVLLLDEATSALDAEAEQAVQEGLRRAMAGRTVLVIAHRLSTVQEADEILLLQGGVIQERGSHRSLMAQGGSYRELCDRQLIQTS